MTAEPNPGQVLHNVGSSYAVQVAGGDLCEEDPTERDVWWSELLGLIGAGGVLLGGFLAFTLASWLAPQLRGVWTLVTVIPSSWFARRVYAELKRRQGFTSPGLGLRL